MLEIGFQQNLFGIFILLGKFFFQGEKLFSSFTFIKFIFYCFCSFDFLNIGKSSMNYWISVFLYLKTLTIGWEFFDGLKSLFQPKCVKILIQRKKLIRKIQIDSWSKWLTTLEFLSKCTLYQTKIYSTKPVYQNQPVTFTKNQFYVLKFLLHEKWDWTLQKVTCSQIFY